MTNRCGFTGTRGGATAAAQLNWLRAAFSAGAQIHHGAYVGSDAQMHECSLLAGSPVVAHPPIDLKLRMRCDPRATWLPAKDYLDRDRDIVDATHLPLATPDGPKRPESGTWYTVQYPVKTGKPVHICYPDGTVEKQ